MNIDSKEHLSELMDGEIGGETGRFVLRRLEASEELRGAWARYHLIRDCMRYQDRGFADDELCQRVRQAIDDTDMQPAHVLKGGNRWLKPVTGLAVAAGVALMAVVAVSPNVSTTDGFAPQQTAAASAQPFTSPNILSGGPESRQVSLNGQQQATTNKMDSYLLRHYQVAGSSAGKGFVSFVPIVTAKPVTQPVTQNRATDQNPSDNESDQEQP